MTATNNLEKAKLDMKSAENTANIMKYTSRTEYAAGYCDSFIFPDGKTKGLLPAFGWLWTAYDNKSAVDACLAACGATAMETGTERLSYYWASTLWGISPQKERACWILRWSDGKNTGGIIDTDFWVRPFAEYN